MARQDSRESKEPEKPRTRSPHERRMQRWKDWYIDRRTQERILQRRRERREREEAFRGRKPGGS